ncbi:MAG: phospholipase D-like domain-containing protein [Cyanobacteria bacterium P01_G01_bin.38]
MRRNQRILGRWGLCFVAGLLMALGVFAWRGNSSGPPVIDALPQDPYIQVFFNHSQASTYTEPYRHTERYGDDLEAVILDAIGSATMSIDIAVQELNLPQIAEALVDKHNAGVKVRLIFENQYSQPWSRQMGGVFQQDERSRGKLENLLAFSDRNGDGQLTAQEALTSDALLILQTAQIPLLDDTADGSKGSGLMHHKFMVVDGQRVLTGAVNWTFSGIHGDQLVPESRGNANVLLQIESPELARSYTDEFNLMWGDGPGGQTNSLFGSPKPARAAQQILLPGSTVTVQFSPNRADAPPPETVNGLIASTLAQANREIDVALFVFSDQGIADTLEKATQTGVAIRALIDRSFVYRSYSEALDMVGVSLPDHRCQYEKNNRPWGSPIHAVGYPELPDGDKLHHKFAVMDGTTVIVGSHNWSKAANTKNDENLLVIRNPTVARHFQREFERLYGQASLGQTSYLQNQIAKHQQKCG